MVRVAKDIAYRADIRQGALAPNEDDEMAPTEGIVSVLEAAETLGISRSAVVKAAQAGRLKGKIGGTWALLRRSVERYEVAEHRVAAGRWLQALRMVASQPTSARCCRLRRPTFGS